MVGDLEDRLPDGDGAYESSHHSHWNYWKREFLAYQSGLLDALPPGLTAPRCFGAAALIALRWGLSLPMILGMALDESRHAWIEQTFGLPAAPWIHRWGDASDFLLDQADHARRFVG